MKLRPEQLARHLQEPIKPVYAIYGEEPLLIQEAADTLRAAARKQGCTDREIMHAERGADWNELLASASNLSLFGDRKLIEVRFNGKPDTEAANTLERYAERPSPDNVLLIVLPKLDAAAQKTKWFTALDNGGVCIGITAIDRQALPEWLAARARHAGLDISPEAITLLTDKVEGNLLAGLQEIEKLRLLFGAGAIDAEQVRDVVGDSSRYSLSDLVDSMLEGQSARAARVLLGLKAEGETPSAVLWAISRDLRALVGISEGLAQGQQAYGLMQQHGIWQKRQPLIQKALRRHTPAKLRALLQDGLTVDKAIKGQHQDNPWDAMLRLVSSLAGKELFPHERSE